MNGLLGNLRRSEGLCLVGRARADQVTVRDGAFGRATLSPRYDVAQRRRAVVLRTASPVAGIVVS